MSQSPSQSSPLPVRSSQDFAPNLPPSVLDDPAVFKSLGDPLALKAVLRRVLPKTGPRVRAKLAHCLHLLACGNPWKSAEATSGVSWHTVQAYKRNYPDFADLYNVAEACRDAIRQARRVDAMQERAVDGWEEPVWYKGVQVGTVRKFSDKLLELGLRAGEPDKYGDRPQAQVSFDVAISFVSEGVDHSHSQRRAIDVTGQVQPAKAGTERGQLPRRGKNTRK